MDFSPLAAPLSLPPSLPPSLPLWVPLLASVEGAQLAQRRLINHAPETHSDTLQGCYSILIPNIHHASLVPRLHSVAFNFHKVKKQTKKKKTNELQKLGWRPGNEANYRLLPHSQSLLQSHSQSPPQSHSQSPTQAATPQLLKYIA